VLLSEKTPVAVNCFDVPSAIAGLVGVTEMDASVAAVTVRLVKPEMLPKVAVIVVVPEDDDETFPLEPAVLLIAAIDADDEYQVTDDVRS
jgi:phage tail sheath protein FI